MESANKNQHWNSSIASRVDGYWLALVAGVALIVILAGLTGFNSFLGMLIALLLLLMVVVIPRPILIVYGLVFIMPLTGGFARGSVVPVLRLGQALLVLGFILFLLTRSSPQGKSRLTVIDLAFALFFLAEAVFPVLAIYSRGEHLNLNGAAVYGESPLQTLLGPLQYYLLYRIVVATISSERQIKLVLELSFIASIIVSIIGILEKVIPAFRILIEMYYPPVKFGYVIPEFEVRVGSTLAFYSGLAAYLVFIIIVALTCYTSGKRLGIHPLLLITTILLSSITLVLTGTFAAWIGLAVGAVAVLILMRRVPKLVFFIPLGIALAAILFQPFLSARLDQQFGVGAAQGLLPQSLAFRIQLWENLFLPAIGQHLLFGSGPAPAVLNSWPAEESQYLLLLLRGGLAYFFSYLLLIGAAAIIGWRQIKNKSGDASHVVAVSLIVILITMSVMNVSGEYFTYVGGTQVLWTLLAIAVASRQFKTQDAPAVVEQSTYVRKRWRGKTLHQPLNEATEIISGKPAHGLLTRKELPLSSMPRAIRVYQNIVLPERPRSTSKLRRIINNTIISFLGQAINWTSTLLLTIAYGHFLGAFKFGELYFAVAFVGLVGVPVNSGFDRQAIRDVAQQPEKAASYLSNMLLIRFGLWFILYVVFLLASWLLGYSPEVRVLVAICGFDLLWNALASTFASLHYAFERTVFPVVGNILEKGLSALFGILLLRAGAGVQTMAIVIVAGSLINGVWQATWFFRLIGGNFSVDWVLIRQIMRKNIPFFINGALWTGYTTIDTVLLSLMTSSIVVGWYGAATRLFDTMSFLPTIVITSIMYPIFAKLSLASDRDLKRAFEKSVNFLLFCGIPIATMLIVAAPNIIRLLYGRNEFAQSIPVLQAAAPGVVFAFLNYALSSTLLSKKQDSKLPIVSGIALAFNLGLNVVLILLYQHIGAAIASSLTEVLVCCCLVAFHPRHLVPFGSLRVALKAIIASLVMALVILTLHTLHFFVILPIAMLVYVGVAVLIGVIPREDYLALYRAIRQKAQPTSRPSANDLPETPLPAYYADELLEDGLATTVKLPTIKRQPMQQLPPIQQGQIVPVSDESPGNKERFGYE